MSIALCKCEIDMSQHEDMEVWGELPEGTHLFEAAGTRHRCEEMIEFSTTDWPGGATKIFFTCPRPAYHKDEGVECGPLTGNKLW